MASEIAVQHSSFCISALYGVSGKHRRTVHTQVAYVGVRSCIYGLRRVNLLVLVVPFLAAWLSLGRKRRERPCGEVDEL